MRGEQAIFNLDIMKKSGLSLNPDIHHSKVFSSGQILFGTSHVPRECLQMIKILKFCLQNPRNLFIIYATFFRIYFCIHRENVHSLNRKWELSTLKA